MEDNIPTLGLFTEKFSSRIIEIVYDIDIEVALQAIGLVKQLFRFNF
jgi:cohesin complex subunit SA-1/2